MQTLRLYMQPINYSDKYVCIQETTCPSFQILGFFLVDDVSTNVERMYKIIEELDDKPFCMNATALIKKDDFIVIEYLCLIAHLSM